ncbi:MAG: Swt1 family HEPN domain-containing protein [Halieaceae bacterium]|nr:Swt1 family HEPN domain-containing protein [Halieaceae bacterium]
MNKLRIIENPALEHFRLLVQSAETLRSMAKKQSRQVEQLATALGQANVLWGTELQRQAEGLAQAHRQATQCANTLSELTAPYRPATQKIEALSADLARTVEPYKGVITSLASWEKSLVARMELIKTSWVLPEHFEKSLIGFARLSRLSDAAHTEKPYSAPVVELVASELGDGLETFPDNSASDRDAAAVCAGLNSELISFPTDAYNEVVLAAGFNFRFARLPAAQAVEPDDSGAVLDPAHWQVLTEVERRLRHTVEKTLTELSGPKWIRKRVAPSVRQGWEQRQEEERKAGRTVYKPIEYANFMELADVIGQTDNWRDGFEPIFRNRDDLIVSLRRLHPVRKAIAHSRPLSRYDILTLVNEATRIFGALGIRILS